MKLVRAHIENFRSIKSLQIDFAETCQALIGINESGKSNILKALQLLDPTCQPTPTDLRMTKRDEPPVREGSVSFEFALSDEQVAKVYEAVGTKFDPLSGDAPVVARKGSSSLTLRQLCDERRQAIYHIELPGGQRTMLATYALPASYSIEPGWAQSTSKESITFEDLVIGTRKIAGEAFFVSKAGLSSSVPSAPVSLEQIDDLITAEVEKIAESSLPKCVMWKYAEQYLLPSSIDVTAFSQKPDSCIPLKSMFQLAGHKAADIAKDIADARGLAHHRYAHLLDRTAEAATKHIRNVWKDYKTVQLQLRTDGQQLVPIIADKEVGLDMANRSDGFKRFVSFLLQISAQVRTASLSNILLLVDEPEIALHPAGARNLTKELIEIGEKGNWVVYSTHSIFMVDRNRISRHLVVEKNHEVTMTWRAEQSRIQDEEVLYSAMGYSIFEALRENNVVFEGWRDREIFRVTCKALGQANEAVRDYFELVGQTYAEGVKDIKHVARFLELASRGCLIVSDADTAALAMKKEYEKPGHWGKWVTLRDVLGPGWATGEDLLQRAHVMKKANKFRAAVANLGPIAEADFQGAEPTIVSLRRWLASANLEDGALKTKLDELKEALYDGLKRGDIKDDAERLVHFVMGYDFAVAG